MPNAQKRIEQVSRTDMHQGLSVNREEVKWANVMNMRFRSRKTKVIPRKRVIFTIN